MDLLRVQWLLNRCTKQLQLYVSFLKFHFYTLNWLVFSETFFQPGLSPPLDGSRKNFPVTSTPELLQFTKSCTVISTALALCIREITYTFLRLNLVSYWNSYICTRALKTPGIRYTSYYILCIWNIIFCFRH